MINRTKITDVNLEIVIWQGCKYVNGTFSDSIEDLEIEIYEIENILNQEVEDVEA